MWVFPDPSLLSWPPARVGSLLTAAQPPMFTAALRSYSKRFYITSPNLKRATVERNLPYMT